MSQPARLDGRGKLPQRLRLSEYFSEGHLQPP
jgi:hypothetical protein